MEEAQIVLERHEQQLKTLERDVSDLKAVQAEIRSMNETLATLANELKHTNQHLGRHEQKIEEIEERPKITIRQISVSTIAAIVGGLISVIVGIIFK